MARLLLESTPAGDLITGGSLQMCGSVRYSGMLHTTLGTAASHYTYFEVLHTILKRVIHARLADLEKIGLVVIT